MSTFNRDVEIGEAVEWAISSLLPHQHVLKAMGNERGFDLIGYDSLEVGMNRVTLEGARRYEVKRDLVGDRTGNLAIEVLYTGRPSGISTTEADVWVQVFADSAHFMDVQELKEFIRMNKQFLRLTRGGENAMFVLLSRSHLHHIRSWEQKNLT